MKFSQRRGLSKTTTPAPDVSDRVGKGCMDALTTKKMMRNQGEGEKLRNYETTTGTRDARLRVLE